MGKQQLQADALGYSSGLISLAFAWTLSEWLAILGFIFTVLTFVAARFRASREEQRRQEEHEADMRIKALKETELRVRLGQDKGGEV